MYTIISAVRTNGGCVFRDLTGLRKGSDCSAARVFCAGALILVSTPHAFCRENFPMAGAKQSNQLQDRLSPHMLQHVMHVWKDWLVGGFQPKAVRQAGRQTNKYTSKRKTKNNQADTRTHQKTHRTNANQKQ